MLVEEGGADGEAGGDSPSSSAKLQLIGALRRGVCGAAAATGWEGRIDGARGRLGRIGLLRFDSAEPTVILRPTILVIRRFADPTILSTDRRQRTIMMIAPL